MIYHLSRNRRTQFVLLCLLFVGNAYTLQLSAKPCNTMYGGAGQPGGSPSCALPSGLSGGLVAYYPFCGNPNDVVGNNNPVFNNATLTTDRFGNVNSAYNFNGNGQYIKGVCTNFPSGNRTISFWVKLNTLANHPVPVGYGGGVCGSSFLAEINSTDMPGTYACQGHCYARLCRTTKMYPQNTDWFQWTITSGNGITRFYINGVLSETFTGTDFNGTGTAGKDYIFGASVGPGGNGAYTDGNVGYLNGYMDDIAIYNTVLDAAKVQELYQYQSSGTTATPSCPAMPPYVSNRLIAFYPFCGDANDKSGNNNNPVFNSATLTTDRFGAFNSAYNFDGTQYIQGPCTKFPSASRTISFWYKTADYTRHNGLFAYGGGGCGSSFIFTMDQTDRPLSYTAQGHCNARLCTSTNNYPSGKGWNNVIITSGNGVTKFYLNGVLNNSFNTDFTGTSTAGKEFVIGALVHPSGIGAYADVNVSFFNGQLDDLAIYDTVFGQNDVSKIYDYFSSGTYAEANMTSGYTNAEVSVGEGGEAAVSLALNIPKGTLQPSLALNYTSQNGNGLQGLGFVLSGPLQAITRVGATYEQDGFSAGVKFDKTTDRYALNGMRLVPNFPYKNMPDGYLTNASAGEFRTEQESFSRIIARTTLSAQNGWQAESFTVYTKDGLIMEFGNSADSRIEASGTQDKVYAWLLNKVSDRNGNYYTINYAEDNANGEYRPVQILYSGNTAKNITPYNKIVFKYENRPDSVTKYFEGYFTKFTKRLTEITAYDHDSLYRKYKIRYMPGSSLSKIIQVTEFGFDSTTCLKPVTINWNQQPGIAGFSKEGTSMWSGHSGGPGNNIFGDFDGNGMMDLAGHGGNGTWHVSLSNGSGFSNSFWQAGFNTAYNNLVGDFNGDGKSDIAGYNAGFWEVGISTGKAFVNSNWNNGFLGPAYTQQYALDLNGDGLSDIACYKGNGNWDCFLSKGNSFQVVSWNDGYAGGNGACLVGDYNGDGKMDLAAYSSGGQWRISLSTGSSFESYWWNGNSVGISNSTVGDFNGDGLTDLIGFLGNAQWLVCLSTGKYFQWFYWTAHNGGMGNNAVGDFNADGIIDMATYTSWLTWNVFLGTGSGFENAGYWAGHAGGIGNNTTADFNGDGTSDLIGYDSRGVWHTTLSNASKEFVSSVKNGNGVSYSFYYSPLSSADVYQKDSQAVYPTVDFTGSFYVVSKLAANDGIGGVRSTYFKYANAKINSKGRGFLGFEKHIRIDTLSNTVSTNWYNTTMKYAAAKPVRTEIRTVGNKLLELTENTIRVDKTLFASDTVYFVYNANTTVSAYELDGNMYKRKSADHAFDAYGNETDVSVTDNNGYRVYTKNTFKNDIPNWILGRVTESVVTKSMPGKTSFTKNLTFVYDAKGNLINETLLPSDAILKLQTDYTLDSFGNRVVTTVSGPGITSRSNKNTISADGRDVIESQDALGYKIKTAFRNGLPASVTDANGRATIITRDLFGRETMLLYTDGRTKKTSYNDCLGGGCPVNGKYYIQQQTSGSVTTKTYYDQFDRPVRTEAESFAGNNIITDKVYNADGTLYKVSDPYYSGASANWTVYGYDEIKRMVSKIEPGNRVTGIRYNGLSTTVTNPLNQKTTKIENPQGKLVASIDNAGSQLSYDYDCDLNLTSVAYPGQQSLLMNYNKRGNKIYMKDPDMGVYTYTFNTLGLMTAQVSPKGETTSWEFDLLNRRTKRTEQEGVTQWIYDPANAIGDVYQVKVNSRIVQQNTYNTAGKLSQVRYIRNNQTKDFLYSYNSTNGQLDTLKMPNNVAIKYSYTKGYLASVTGINIKPANVTLWTAGSYDLRNELASFSMGNGLVTTLAHDPVSSFLTSIQTVATGPGAGGASVQNLSYTFSSIGNLMERKDINLGLKESFGFDELNRLTQSQVEGQKPLKIQYDGYGNIVFKSDVGTYRYAENGMGPHTLTSIDHSTIDSCAYNFNQTIAYTSFNYASKITNNNTEIAFQYGADREREVMTVKKNNLLVQTKNYYGGMYEEVTNQAGAVSYNYYIGAGSRVIAILNSTGTNVANNSRLSYLLTDHLNSVYAYTDETGKIIERASFDAWGKQRDPLTWGVYKAPQNLPGFQRGFTFHEMLDMDFLICMNARVYNPVLGRFLSADPYVQFPDDLQSLNRYAYVLNNPLSFTDPSGHFLSGLKGFLQKNSTIVIIGASLAGAFLAPQFVGITKGFWAAVLSGAGGGFGSSFTATLLNGGSFGNALQMGLKQAVIGGIKAGALAGVDYLSPSWLETQPGVLPTSDRLFKEAGNMFGRSVVNGVFASATGGSYRKSFFNSLLWQSVDFSRDLLISQYNAFEKDSYFKDAKSTFKNGEGTPQIYSFDDKERLIKNPNLPNQGMDPIEFMPTRTIFGINVEAGGPNMNFLTTYLPGINSHAISHDPFMTMVGHMLRIQDGALFTTLNVVTQAPVLYLNYGVLFNQYGLNNFKNLKQ